VGAGGEGMVRRTASKLPIPRSEAYDVRQNDEADGERPRRAAPGQRRGSGCTGSAPARRLMTAFLECGLCTAAPRLRTQVRRRCAGRRGSCYGAGSHGRARGGGGGYLARGCAGLAAVRRDGDVSCRESLLVRKQGSHARGTVH